jgi:DNA-directed RNA polymerase subunit M/transcription elongation factor TFIIS
MKFCDNCGNMLIPKNKKLYCKACEEEFDLGKSKGEYKIQKKFLHDEKESAPIILKEGFREERISSEDRKAYEDLFSGSDGNAY